MQGNAVFSVHDTVTGCALLGLLYDLQSLLAYSVKVLVHYVKLVICMHCYVFLSDESLFEQAPTLTWKMVQWSMCKEPWKKMALHHTTVA